MKISAIALNNCLRNSSNKINNVNFSNSLPMHSGYDSFEKHVPKKSFFNTVSFMGYNVHILDGGAHAQNMEHFAQSLNADMDITMHSVEINVKSENDKQMKSLYEQLKAIPPKKGNKAEYIALPGLCNVPLQNIEDQYFRVMGESIKLTPENVKSQKTKLIAFLKKISDYPNAYRKYIDYMDPNGQGVEWVYDVITEINKRVKEGYKVYVPSGHPEYQSLKWLAGKNGKKPELQYFISNHQDIDNSVNTMRKYIQDRGWYDFNLLNLSDAHIVNLKDKGGKDDYIYAAYDATVTGGERGVYNFCPIRDEEGKIKGYSYSDTYTVQYPYTEFPANAQIENISKFVGRNISEVRADEDKTKDFKDYLKGDYNGTAKDFADYLFKVDDVFTLSEITREKMNLKGTYVDSSRKLFFDTNTRNQVIFPNCDCEGSKRPSVLSMWGSCFSIFNAIKKSIEYEEKKIKNSSIVNSHSNYETQVNRLLQKGMEASKYNGSGYYKEAEDYFNNAIELGKIANVANAQPYISLGDLHFKHGNNEAASSCYNQAINILSCEIVDSGNTLYNLWYSYDRYHEALIAEDDYEKATRQYKAKSALYRFFNSEPTQPTSSNYYYGSGVNLYKVSQQIPKLFENLSKICEAKNENYPAKVCRAAAREIGSCSSRGTEVIKARAQGIQYIGNIFDEIKP